RSGDATPAHQNPAYGSRDRPLAVALARPVPRAHTLIRGPAAPATTRRNPRLVRNENGGDRLKTQLHDSSPLRFSLRATTSGWPCTPRFPARSHAAFNAGNDSALVMSSSAAATWSGPVSSGWTVNGARLP